MMMIYWSKLATTPDRKTTSGGNQKSPTIHTPQRVMTNCYGQDHGGQSVRKVKGKTWACGQGVIGPQENASLFLDTLGVIVGLISDQVYAPSEVRISI